VWDTGKIASFGLGFGYTIFNTMQSGAFFDDNNSRERLFNDKLLGPIIEAEVGITGYEYSTGVKFGKIQNLQESTYLFTIFIGRSKNWISLKTNINTDHYVTGMRLINKFKYLALKVHTDFKNKKIISVQFGLGQ
jgi:hypothetical protein